MHNQTTTIDECIAELKTLIDEPPNENTMKSWCIKLNVVECNLRHRLISQLPKLNDHARAHEYESFVNRLPLCGQVVDLYEDYKTALLGPFDRAGNLISSLSVREIIDLHIPLLCVTITKMIQVVENDRPDFMT